MILGMVGEWLALILVMVGEWFLMILVTNVEGGHFRQHALRFGLNNHRAVSSWHPNQLPRAAPNPNEWLPNLFPELITWVCP